MPDTPRTARMRGDMPAIYGFLQEQPGPHLQLSPHPQPGAWLFAWVLWQPQLQAAPGQGEQLHDFELVDILKLL